MTATTVTIDQQLLLGHIDHESNICLPKHLFTPYIENEVCDLKQTNSVILNHHLTNITVLYENEMLNY